MSTPPPSPSSVGHGTEEERGKGAEEEEETAGKATKTTVKAEAGEDSGGGALNNIKVQSQTAEDVFFRVKHSLDPKAVRFLSPYGGYVRPNQTPDEAGLQDGDEIAIVLTQLGGGAAPAPHASQSPA